MSKNIKLVKMQLRFFEQNFDDYLKKIRILTKCK